MSVFVGISGGTGSGKTTIAKEIVQRLEGEAVLFEMDCYYKDVSHLSKEEVLQYNFDHPDAMDFDLMQQHLKALKANETISKPIYEFAEHRRSFSYEEFLPKPYIIVEGIFALHANLLDLYDQTIFVDVPEDVRLDRRLKRDLEDRGRSEEEVRGQFERTVKPMHDQFVEPTKAHANHVVQWMTRDDSLIESCIHIIREERKQA